MTCRKDHRAIALGLPQDDRPMSVRFYGPCKGTVGRPCGLLTTIARVCDNFWAKMTAQNSRCPHDHRAVPVRGMDDVTAMCLRTAGLRFFQICHCAELNKIVEATMPANPYDDDKVSLRRPHGNCNLNIIRASYTCRKANVTEA